MSLKRNSLRVRITPALDDQLRELSEETGLNTSELCRLAIESGLPRVAQKLKELRAPEPPAEDPRAFATEKKILYPVKKRA